MRERLSSPLRNLLRSKFVQDTITLQAGKLALTAINFATFAIVARGLGSEAYGVYRLALTMHGLLMTLNLTGLGPSTITRLSEAIGGHDRARTRDLMGFFVQMSLIVALIASGAAFTFGPAFAGASYDNPFIGELMRLYTLILFFRPIYNLSLIALQSTRAMRRYTALENGASLFEALLKIAAVLPGGGPMGIIVAHLVAAIGRAGAGIWVYRRLQRQQPEVLPTVREVITAARRNSPRPYWRFGVLLALDKNLAGLYTLLPQQLLGMWAGEAAVGFLNLGLGALQYPALLFSGILTNLAARLPAAAGSGDYARLAANFRRVMRWIAPLAVGMYGLFALLAPVVVFVLGPEYVPATQVIRILCLYGAVTAIGGIFGPLYRTLRLMRAILAVKVAALALAALPAAWLIQTQGAAGGAWAIDLVYAIAVALTIGVTWPHLRRLAELQARPVGE